MGLVRTFKVGAQPVVDGVMVRGRSKYAIAMRKTNGNILLDKNDVKFFSRIPILFIRGIVSSIESGILGFKSLLFSTEYFDNENVGNANNIVASKEEMYALEDRRKAEEAEGWLKYSGALIAGIIAIIAFFILPVFIASIFFNNVEERLWFNIVEGVSRILLYVLFLVVFKFIGSGAEKFRQYLAAEHKAINCFEKGLELNIENVNNQSPFHPRCGFTILFNTILISSIAFVFLGIENLLLAILFRLLILLLSIGVSYEISRFFGLFNGKFSRGLAMIFGMWTQAFVLSNPDEIKMFIALTALKNAMTED